MKNLPYIVTAVLIVLTALFAILNRVWTGFVYFVLSSLLLLALFWGVWQTFQYFTEYKKELDEAFKFYRAKLVGEGNVSAETFDTSEKAYRKQFEKSMRKEKFVKWGIILFCFATACAFLAGMILY